MFFSFVSTHCASFMQVESKLSPLSFDPTFMKDAQCVETNEKSILWFFIFWAVVKIHRKLTVFRIKMIITRKMNIGKIWNLILLSIHPILNFHVNLTERNKKHQTSKNCFDVQQNMCCTYVCKTLKPGWFFWNAVDTNLTRLRLWNVKKNWFFLMFEYFWRKNEK